MAAKLPTAMLVATTGTQPDKTIGVKTSAVVKRRR
jgi:hypothetical protein